MKKFKTIDDVVNHFQLYHQKENFLTNFNAIEMPELLKQELQYVIGNIPYKVSEAAIRENILYPVLKDVFKKYDDLLMLWANKSIAYNKELSGMPNYILAKQSVRGKIIFGKPLLAVVEAKKDDFEGGWAQCLLEILQPNRSLQRNIRRKMAQVIRWIGEKGRCIHNIRGRVHVPYRSS